MTTTNRPTPPPSGPTSGSLTASVAGAAAGPAQGPAVAPGATAPEETVDLRLRGLPRSLVWLLRAAAAAAVLLAVNQIFNLRFFVGRSLIELGYLYLLLGLALPMTFLRFAPAWRGGRVGLALDMLLALAAAGICVWFAVHSMRIVSEGWEMTAPRVPVILSCILWVLVVEAARRAGGTFLAIVIALVSTYPIFADRVPGVISGFPSPLDYTAAYHALSAESIMGIPVRTFGNLVIGFIVFGAALQHTGAGRFFLDLAFALLGKVRGGPAKVAIFASGMMGSLSGSVVSNVMTTGVMTIPAMRRTGLSRPFAGGVEACASTGGVLMPPVMGATAFVMASFIGMPYASVAIAALVPSLLFYIALFVQIDARAATERMSGLDSASLPDLWTTLREGWHHLFAIALLVVLLLVLRYETLAPFYATPVLIAMNQILSPRTRWGLKEVGAFLDSLVRLFAELVAILAGVGLIIGALTMTGVAGTLVNDILRLAGGSQMLLLLMGAATSFVLGIGMTVTAAYIFLAVLLAPALMSTGLDPLAVHMFIFYWGMLSFITPPVALGAFAAASVAGASPMRTAFEAMRLGSVIYLLPFFFVLDPALLLQGSPQDVVFAIAFALLGVCVFAGAVQGYVLGIGAILPGHWLAVPARIWLAVAACILAMAGSDVLPFGKLESLGLFALLSGPVLLAARLSARRSALP